MESMKAFLAEFNVFASHLL